MNFADWYTDLFKIERNVAVVDGDLTKQVLQVIADNLKGRVYRRGGGAPKWNQTDAQVTQSIMLACDNSIDIRPGDRLTIQIGGALGYDNEVIKARAGVFDHYYEPFGAVIPQLAHQQGALEEVMRI